MKILNSPIYRFGEVEVDALRGAVRLSGKEVYLRLQSLQVLLYLLDNRERVVSKDELIEQLWRDTAVTDNALFQSIVEIRKAIGDDSRHPRWIRTMPKAGYHFIGKVEEAADNHSALFETEEVTAIQIELKEEISGEDRLSGEIRRPVVSAARFVSKRRLVLGLTAMAILAATVSWLVFGGRKALTTDSPATDVSLPRALGKLSVAVVYFENRSGDSDLDWMREGLPDMIITGLSRSQHLLVFSRQQLHSLISRAGREPDQSLTVTQAIEIGRPSEAAVVMGTFAKLGQTIRIEAQILDSKTGVIIAAEQLVADAPDQILKQIDLLSLKLAARLALNLPPPDPKPGLADVMTDNLEAYRHYSLGVEKAQSHHNAEAIKLLERAAALDPEFAMAHARIGYAYVMTWTFGDKAKPYLEKAYRLSHRLTEKDRLHIKAWYAVANYDYQGAINFFQEIIASYPLEVEAYYRLGRLLTGEGRLEEALGVLEKGLAIDGNAKELHNAQGLALSWQGKHGDAIAALERYVALAPDEANAHDSLGLGYQCAGRFAEAVREYDRALALKPDFDIPRIHKGNTYVQQGRYRDAITEFEAYIKAAPSGYERSRAYCSIADIYFRKGELKHASAAAASGMKHENMAAWTMLALALERGDKQKAAQMKLLVSDIVTPINRGQRETARTTLYRRGYLDLREGRAAAAIENFKEALRHPPPYWNIDPLEDCLANAYFKLGRLDEAIAEYERVLKLNSNYPLAGYRLAQAYEQNGDPEHAQSAYEGFLEVWHSADDDVPEVIAAKARLTRLKTGD